MNPLRTRFKRDIVAEFLPPARYSNKVIILLDGMPSVPSKRSLLEFFAKKNYWVFHPRYRGTWESGGAFLRLSPHQDILDIIGELPRGFKEAWGGKTYRVRPKSIFLFGASFGGTAALLASHDPRVTKVVALSPVIDWKVESKKQPVAWMGRWVKSAFGEGYRYTARDWKKLGNGDFFDPLSQTKKLLGEKILVVHAKNDEVVQWEPAVRFSKIIGARLVLKKKGGHFSSSKFMEQKFYRLVKKFLHSASVKR